MRRATTASVRLAGALLASAAAFPVAAFELGDLFRTPGQRAAARFESGEHEALVENAPDAAWEGIGRYATGDARGAADAFARALEVAPPSPAGDTLLYNRATAETRAGRLDDAIALYDELLERDPAHEDALHNREVARALKALEERGGSSSEGGEGDETGEADGEGERSEGGGAGSEAGDAAGDEPADEPGESDGSAGDGGDADPAASGDPEGGESRDERAADGDDDGDGDDANAPDAARQAEERAAAAAALEAERERGERSEEEGAEARVAAETRTPSEREQATEQWLRRIADDPSGLLRRRLERSHRGDYPEVGDGDEPW